MLIGSTLKSARSGGQGSTRAGYKDKKRLSLYARIAHNQPIMDLSRIEPRSRRAPSRPPRAGDKVQLRASSSFTRAHPR